MPRPSGPYVFDETFCEVRKDVVEDPVFEPLTEALGELLALLQELIDERGALCLTIDDDVAQFHRVAAKQQPEVAERLVWIVEGERLLQARLGSSTRAAA